MAEETKKLLLDKAQEEAIRATEGPVMVISCAGSGKTTVILNRAAAIAQKTGRLERILTVTFSKAAAKELEERYKRDFSGKELSQNASGRAYRYQDRSVRFATIHSICYSILAGAYGLRAENILTEKEKKEFFMKLHETLLEKGERIPERYEDFRSEAETYISRAMTGLARNSESENKAQMGKEAVRPERTGFSLPENRVKSGKKMIRQEEKRIFTSEDEAERARDEREKKLGREKQKVYERVLHTYGYFKQKNQKVDYDDMILKSYQCLKEQEAVRAYWQDMFDYIMIDEYQDTSSIQAEIFLMLSEKHRNLCVVGDDDQCIYGFRGADSSIFLKFQQYFPECRKIYLTTNYRSRPLIVKRASKLIACNKKRFFKEFVAGRAEEDIQKEADDSLQETAKEPQKAVRMLCCGSEMKEIEAILRYLDEGQKKGENWSDTAVLYRTRNTAAALVNRLLLEKIPFYIRELPMDIHKGLVCRDICAYYRLAQGIGGNQDLIQILNRPKRYLKSNLLRGCKPDRYEMYNACIRESGTQWEYDRINDTINQLFLDLRNLKKLEPEAFLDYLIEKMGYGQGLKEYCEYRGLDWEEQEQDIAALVYEAGCFPNMEAWYQYVSGQENSPYPLDKEGVYLSTFHGAKGLEWPRVCILGADENVTPLKREGEIADMEEERRLFYVAMTRAREELVILSASESGFGADGKGYDSGCKRQKEAGHSKGKRLSRFAVESIL